MKHILLYAVLSLFSAVIGGTCVALFTNSSGVHDVVQTRRLEIVDRSKEVRGVFEIDAAGKAKLEMFSKHHTPLMTLRVDDGTALNDPANPLAALTLYNGVGQPAVSLQTGKTGQGVLTFSNGRLSNQIRLGYSLYGDVDDGHERGLWGLQIAGPGHTQAGVNMFSLDGVLQGQEAPIAAPPKVVNPPR